MFPKTLLEKVTVWEKVTVIEKIPRQQQFEDRQKSVKNAAPAVGSLSNSGWGGPPSQPPGLSLDFV